MRYIFATEFQKIAEKDPTVIFMTGDLGFNAFETLRGSIGSRFINAGVAEHNMVTTAAGLAYTGFKPWIYSIAPFVSIKVLEEIRNDVCLPQANVKIVALGGGFDYAIAGPTHHALEDIALMSTMPHMKLYIPSFPQDLRPILTKMSNTPGPAYFRLTKAHETDISLPPYAPLRKIFTGNRLTVVVLGSLTVEVIEGLKRLEDKIDLWTVSELPFTITPEFELSIKKTKHLCIIEEHIESGGLGQYIGKILMQNSYRPDKFLHLFVKGYKSGLYGSRDFYLKENQLDRKSIGQIIKKYLV